MAKVIYFKNDKNKTARQILKQIDSPIGGCITNIEISKSAYEAFKFDGVAMAQLVKELLEEEYNGREFMVELTPYKEYPLYPTWLDSFKLTIEWREIK